MATQLATFDALKAMKRSELRDLAKSLGIRRGQNKINTIENLIESGKVSATAAYKITADRRSAK